MLSNVATVNERGMRLFLQLPKSSFAPNLSKLDEPCAYREKVHCVNRTRRHHGGHGVVSNMRQKCIRFVSTFNYSNITNNEPRIVHWVSLQQCWYILVCM